MALGPDLTVVGVWDVPTRVFHWVNFLCVLLLAGLGLVVLNDSALGVSSDGKLLLKTAHVWVGYAFLVNLLWRFVWAFVGNEHARWRAILPGGRGYLTELRDELAALRSGRPALHRGHGPLGRIAVAALLAMLLVQGGTGLMLAGTDIYYPPFGQLIAEWVAAPGVEPGEVVPYHPELVDEAAYAEMREFREPFVTIHELGFYVLMTLIGLHVLGVVLTELGQGGALVSAMITGRKVLPRAEAAVEPALVTDRLLEDAVVVKIERSADR